MSPSTSRMLWHTPLRDLARGRVTGRLDLKVVLAESKLPVELQGVVLRVVKRTKLWRMEKVDVTRELASHFVEGLSAGQSESELRATFGDERTAAKLIRRAKKRGRPLVWHVANFFTHAFAVFVALYICSGIYYYMGRPTISHDYLVDLNRAALAAPVESRAWPIYRDVYVALRDGSPQGNEKWMSLGRDPDRLLRSDLWDGTAAFLRSNPAQIEKLRVGASRPTFGFVMGPGGSADDAEAFPNSTQPESPEHPLLWTVTDRGIGPVRHLAGALRADARLALIDHDPDRCVLDILAIESMADQMRPGTLMSQLVSIALRGYTNIAVDEAIARSSDAFSDAQLTEIAHRLARVRVSSELIDFQFERLFFYDAMQHAYTDNGSGDGRLAFGGMAIVGGREVPKAAEMLAGGAMPVLTTSRKKVVDFYERQIRELEAGLGKPMRELVTKDMWERPSMLEQISQYPAGLFLPSLEGCHMQCERMLGQRDGVLTAIAAELFRRKHGSYPTSLDQLTPLLLPAVPFDRITGEPLKYRLVDGKPFIYSIGVDRIDDGGTPAFGQRRVAEPSRAASWMQQDGRGIKGDWILFPQSRFVPVELDDDDQPIPATRPTTSPSVD